MIELNEITIEIIEVKARCGSDIYDCIREAIVLSVSESVPVVLSHNCNKYHIDSNKISENIYKQHK